MYARRYADGPRFRPVSLGVALALNGGVVAALLLAAPELIPRAEEPPLVIHPIPLATPEPLPTPEPTRTQPTARSPERPTVTPPLPIPTDNRVRVDETPPLPLPGPTTTGVPIPSVTPIPPAFVRAAIDPRYAAQVQPEYPDTARDAGREGDVRVRVLIGIDGRVKQIERISGDDTFWRVTQRHALARWRFTPATRGGVPEESWKVMNVHFQLN